MKTTSRKAKSVVVVEDQTAICELIIEMLEARGAYRVLGSTADGHEGLALAKQLKPDILILDILLPGISGLEVLRQLHGTQPDLKVLVFSAKSEKQLARGLLKVGVRGYVPKSARLSELRQAVDAVAARENVIARPADDRIVALVAVQDVVACPADYSNLTADCSDTVC